jgi:hypothetical protein
MTEPPTETWVRCPRCNARGCRLEHKTKDGKREGYTDPSKGEAYRCLQHGIFFVGAARAVVDLGAVQLAASRVGTLQKDVATAASKDAVLRRLRDAATTLEEACADALGE